MESTFLNSDKSPAVEVTLPVCRYKEHRKRKTTRLKSTKELCFFSRMPRCFTKSTRGEKSKKNPTHSVGLKLVTPCSGVGGGGGGGGDGTGGGGDGVSHP